MEKWLVDVKKKKKARVGNKPIKAIYNRGYKSAILNNYQI